MKESKKQAIKEWAQENGLQVKDYDEANEIYKERQLALILGLELIVIVGILIYALASMPGVYWSHCTDYFSNLTVTKASAICKDILLVKP